MNLEKVNKFKDNKFSLALSKLKPGVDFIEFKIYYEALKKAYYESVEYYHKTKGMPYDIAKMLATGNFSNDIESVKKGEINFNSKVPGFRRY